MRMALVLALVVPRLVLADVPDDGARPNDGSGAGSAAAPTTAPTGTPSAAPSATAPAAEPFHHKDIVVTTTGERSSKNVAILASIAGAAVVFGGIGLYFHLDSKSASDEVSAHIAQSIPWTAQRQATYDQAHDSATKAEIFYGIGGALVVASVVYMIVTQPKAETTVIHPHVAVGPTGAVLGGSWSF